MNVDSYNTKKLLHRNEEFITALFYATLFRYDDEVYPIEKLLIDIEIEKWDKESEHETESGEKYKILLINFWLECFPGEEGKDTPVFNYEIRYSSKTTIVEFTGMVDELCQIIEARGKE